LRFRKTPYDFLNLYERFCPYNPPYKPGEKTCTPLFLEDENIFQKSASVVPREIEFPVVPPRPIFEKCSHLREKGGVLMLLKTTRHLVAKAQYVRSFSHVRLAVKATFVLSRLCEVGL
jgi:hypothetical protein